MLSKKSGSTSPSVSNALKKGFGKIQKIYEEDLSHCSLVTRLVIMQHRAE